MEQGAKQGFYAGLEDKFYAFMESLEAKGIPAVKFFVEPLENKGVPSFPVAMLLLALLLAGGIFAAWALTVRVGEAHSSAAAQTPTRGRSNEQAAR